MLYEPEYKHNPLITAAVIIVGIPTLWVGIRAYFWAVTCLGEFFLRHHWV